MHLPNIPAKAFTFSAVVVAYLLIDDATTANEQNALGNWLMLAAQVLCTNAVYKQVQNERRETNMNKTPNTEETIIMMEKMIKAMQKELENLKQAKS